ncbi:MAG: autotransporter-associated beta strand repeat-containing protein [Kiritimatiellia bacterium]
MVLGGEMSVAGVVVDDGAAVNLNADAYALTIGAGGVTLNGTAGATSLNASIKLGAAQAWVNNGAGLLTVGGGVVTGGFTLTFGGSGNSAFTGALSGTGGLTKSGSGTLTLSGLNTHTGVTLVSDGTLALGHVSTLAASTLDTGTPGAQQVTFTVAGSNTYNLGGLAGSDDLNLGGNTISVGANGASTTFAGALGGVGGSLTKVGAGTLTLSGGNLHGGTTTVSAGILNLASAGVAVPGPFVMNGPDGTYARMQQPGQFGAGVVAAFTSASGAWNRFELFGKDQTLAGITTGNATTQGGGVIQNSETNGAAGANATLTLNGSGTYVFNGHLRDYGSPNAGTNKLSLIKDGAGTQTLVGTVISYSGTTAVNAGLLRLVDTSVFKSAIANHATVELSAGATGVNLGAGANLSGEGIWNKTGTGIAKINGGQTVTTTGQFNIQQGTLQNDNNAVIWSGSTAGVNISAGAILDLYADSITVNALTGAGFVQNNYGNTTGQSGSAAFFEKLVLGAGGGSGTFTGIIRNNSTNVAPAAGAGKGGIQVEKTGTGTQTLSGANTYTGSTTVTAGGLFITGSGSTAAAGLIQVSGGATLGGGGAAGNATFADAAVFSPGDEDWQGDHVMTLASLTLAGTSVLRYQLQAAEFDVQTVGFYNDSAVITGALVLDGVLRVGNRANHDSPYDFTTALAGDKWLLLKYTPGNLTDNGLVVDSGNSAPLAPGLAYAISKDETFGGVYLDVVAVPEAGSGLLAALGVIILWARRVRGVSGMDSRNR